MTNSHHPHLVSKVPLDKAKERISISHIQNISGCHSYLGYAIWRGAEETTATFSRWQITVSLNGLDNHDWTGVQFKTKKENMFQILTSSSYLTWMPVILTWTFFITWVASFSKKVSFFSSFGLSKTIFFN